MSVAAMATASALLCNGLIGHIHIAKTGGSTLNQQLANKFHGVCGHKGYSFDSYQARRRNNGDVTLGYVKDSINRVYENYDRTRVPEEIMFERGFEACHWVSFESDMHVWKHFENWGEPLELHLPCRDPVEHFMSQVNHEEKKIHCASFRPAVDAGKYLIYMNRFQVAAIPRNATVRCVRFSKQFDDYQTLIGLPKKRIVNKLHPSHIYTNQPRSRKNECIWRHPKLVAELKAHLIKSYDYYNYCSKCTDWVV